MFIILNIMRDLLWSKTEKDIARKAYDEAYEEECKVVAARVKDLMAHLPEPRAVWTIHDFLSQRRREMDKKYDYRYSVLPLVFGNLVRRGRLRMEELSGLREDKLKAIRSYVRLFDDADAA